MEWVGFLESQALDWEVRSEPMEKAGRAVRAGEYRSYGQ